MSAAQAQANGVNANVGASSMGDTSIVQNAWF